MSLRTIAENAGNLSGFPKHVVKLAAKFGGGQNSPVETTHATSHHALKKSLDAALSKGGSVAIHANGQHVASIHPDTSGYTKRSEYSLVNPDGSPRHYTTTHYPKRSNYGYGRNGDQAYQAHLKHIQTHGYRKSTHTNYSKSDVIHHAINALHQHVGDSESNSFAGGSNVSKEAYKTNQFTVHHIGRDANRSATHEKRVEARGHTLGARQWQDRSKPIDKGLEQITHKAADKLATRIAGHDSVHAKTAMEHHAKIGQMIQAGDHHGAMQHLKTLETHLYNARREKGDHEGVKSALVSLKAKDGDWSKERAREKLRSLREDLEQIDELSKKGLVDYIGAASMDKSHHAAISAEVNKDAREVGVRPGSSAAKMREYANKAHGRRSGGIQRAAMKLAGMTKVKPT